MNPSSTAKNVEQVLQKLFSKQIQENIERSTLLEKKIGVSIRMCENFIKQFPNKLSENTENDNRLLCAQFCDELFHRNSTFGILNNQSLVHSKLDVCNNTTSSSLFALPINESKTSTKYEFARLASAKRLSDSLALQLECENVKLKAEIDFLTMCLDDSPRVKNEHVCNDKSVTNLVTECNQLKEGCLKTIKSLACGDHLETSRVKFEQRKARQSAYLDSQDRKIQEAQLACTKLEIFGHIMALEDNALLEMTQCVDKIYTALKKYFEISTDIKSRFQNSENSPQNKSYSVIDSELRELLIRLLLEPSDNSYSPETVSNEMLLKAFGEKIASLEAKNAASLTTVKECGLVAHEISLLLGKALQWLECPDMSEAQQQQHNDVPESPCVYWNALGSFSGVIPHRLVERLLQVRRELDGVSASLRKLELTFELNSDVL